MLDLWVSSLCTPTRRRLRRPPPPSQSSSVSWCGGFITFAGINLYPLRSKFKRTTATSHLTNLHRP